MKITYSALSEEIIDHKINWLNNAKVNRYLYGAEAPNKTTLKKQQVWFAKYQQDNSSKFFTILVDGEAVGMVGLTKINQLEHIAEIFILIGDENYWNKGIGTHAMNYIINYAQDNLKLKELNLSVHKDNTPAIQLFYKVGFDQSNHFGWTTDAFQIIVHGWEIVKGYSELADPVLQRHLLEEQACYRAQGDEEAMEIDKNFLLALEYAMPPVSGVGDRLLAIITDQNSLRDVILFPVLR